MTHCQTPPAAGKIGAVTVEPVGTVAADNNSPGNPREQNERAEESRRKQPGHATGRDCIPVERGGHFATQSVVRPAKPPGKRPERALANDSQDKPPRVLPNTYWSRKAEELRLIAEQAFDVLEFIGSNFEQFETQKAAFETQTA